MNHSVNMRRHEKVPSEIMVPAAVQMLKESGHTVEHWTTSQVEQVKKMCGPSYAHIPVDDIRRQCGNLRRRGRLGAVTGHGPGKWQEPNVDMKEYYATDSWKRFRHTVWEFWNGKCALCNGEGRDVHHRTYERWKQEQLSDCVLLCRNCHKLADRRRAYQKQYDQNEPRLIL